GFCPVSSQTMPSTTTMPITPPMPPREPPPEGMRIPPPRPSDGPPNPPSPPCPRRSSILLLRSRPRHFMTVLLFTSLLSTSRDEGNGLHRHPHLPVRRCKMS